ncbi:glycosyltransferase family 2 protein [Bosea lathyri]|uniref:Glycosyltransferase, GT2 family n=1 Tax=Bosea lathyri TaxID=1036778 RepID=A0A1H5VE36_9HYPH|nr:glycosyltransferase [Bosea lathyri]SEF85316.1 Glycosyltransferase, GT2 family [Bosea lathyri]
MEHDSDIVVLTDAGEQPRLRIVVGIATAGRREVLSQTLDHLMLQARLPDAVIVSPAGPEDIDPDHARSLAVSAEIVMGTRGSCAQRNAILDVCGAADIVVFFDDDYVPAANFLAEVERLFEENPDIVVATGEVVADGIHGPGIGFDEARAILAADGGGAGLAMRPAFNAYGCNMVFRMAAIAAERTRFDEIMPLYGWQEDVDFCRRLASQGRIVHSPALRGVHLGHKRGRTSGLRFGYSQVANPLYLLRKGTVGPLWALRLMLGNLAANLIGSLRPAGMVDRRGRLKGNCIALWEMLRGRLSPQRILTLD